MPIGHMVGRGRLLPPFVGIRQEYRQKPAQVRAHEIAVQQGVCARAADGSPAHPHTALCQYGAHVLEMARQLTGPKEG